MLNLNLGGLETFYGGKNSPGKLFLSGFRGMFMINFVNDNTRKIEGKVILYPHVQLLLKGYLNKLLKDGPDTTYKIRTDKFKDGNTEKGDVLIVGKDSNMMIYIAVQGANMSEADVVRFIFKRPMTIEISGSVISKLNTSEDIANNMFAVIAFINEVLDNVSHNVMTLSSINDIPADEAKKSIQRVFSIFGENGKTLVFSIFNGFLSSSIYDKNIGKFVGKMGLNRNTIYAIKEALLLACSNEESNRTYIHKGTYDPEQKKVVQGVSITIGRDESGMIFIDHKDPDTDAVRFKFTLPKGLNTSTEMTEADKSKLAAKAFVKVILEKLLYAKLALSRDKASMNYNSGGGNQSGGNSYNNNSNTSGSSDSGKVSGIDGDDIGF